MSAPEEIARNAALKISDSPSRELINAICLVSENIAVCQQGFGETKSRRATRKILGMLHANATNITELLESPELPVEFRHVLMRDRVLARELESLKFSTSWLRDYVPIGPGTNMISDCLGMPRPQFLCAAAVVRLWMLQKGAPPSDKNDDALSMCAHLWALAGQPVSFAVRKGQVDTEASWERHIGTVRQASADGRLEDAALGAWMWLNELFRQSGLIAREESATPS
jgi:hypothetical protein